MPFGLTADGFVIKSLTQIRDDLNTAVRAAFGAGMDVGDRSIVGQLNGIIAEAIELVWELAEAVNSSQDPDKASGAALDAICALTGTFREPPTYSVVSTILSGDDAVVVLEGKQIRTASTEVVFAVSADTTLALADDWDTNVSYVIGDVVKNAGNVYYCYNPANDTIAAPTFTQRYEPTDIKPVTATYWVWLSAGDAYAVVNSQAAETGPVVAVAEDLSDILDTVTGWEGVYNPADAVPGTDQETDEDLRARRIRELAGAGTSPADAIYADVARLDSVQTVKVFVNNTDATNGDGMPPHSVEVLVRGGVDQDIFDQLFASVAAGIATHGTEVGSVVDRSGFTQTVKFSRPTEVPIYLDIELIVDTDTYEGDDAVITAILSLDDDDDAVGRDAVAARIIGVIMANVEGVLDVTQMFLDDTAAPATSTTVTMTSRQLATYSEVNIALATTPGTP